MMLLKMLLMEQVKVMNFRLLKAKIKKIGGETGDV
jgi:hypothetical protein